MAQAKKITFRDSGVGLCQRALEAVMEAEEAMHRPVHINPNLNAPEQLVAQAGLNNLKPWARANMRISENRNNRAYEEFIGMHQELNEDGSYHYLTMDDLPDIGRGDYPYKITSTGDMYRFRIDRYVPFNPYGLPVDAAEYFPRKVPAEIIIDDSANMPSGGEGPLAVVWNIHALRRDLWAKGVRDWSYADMLPAGERWRIQPHTTLNEQRNLYFRFAHKALWNQVRTHMRHMGEFKKDYVGALERIGVEVWFKDGLYGFKDGEFMVTFE